MYMRKNRKNYSMEIRHGKFTKRDLINLEKIILKHAKPKQLEAFRFRKRYISIKYLPEIRIMYASWRAMNPAFNLTVYPFYIRLDVFPTYHVKEQALNIQKMILEIESYANVERKLNNRRFAWRFVETDREK